MSGFQPRSRSGPSDGMEIDYPDIYDRLDHYNLASTEDGPSKKRKG